jgi:hypothetical protein
MDDETRLSEVDSRVRAALAADPQSTRHVLEAALANRFERPVPRWHAIVSVAAVILALGAGVWLWQRTAPPPSSLTLTGRGQVIVVESQDGRRWIVGPAPPPRAGGHYVIVIPQ